VMWAVWTGTLWVECTEEYALSARENGFEARCLPLKLEEESRDCTVFPRYCLEGFEAMERYLAVL
jgi:hypothetical protein